MRRTFLLPLIAALLPLVSCQTLHFYGQATQGQVEVLAKSRPNPSVMADPASPPQLVKQLRSVEEIRQFASQQLMLPGDESYGRYSDLGRKHVVWVLYAAPEFSLEPKTWFYPMIGEMDYRGYFREANTTALAGKLRADGYDVYIGGVDAYSTLGWFHDPVLNTFIDYPDIDLAETIFHELLHRRVFHRGDTVYNESLANVVAEEGVRRWLAFHGRTADLRKYQERLVRRREFYQEVEIARARLRKLYASGMPTEAMRSEKAAILEKLRDQFRELRRRWGGHGLESWLEEDLNNGHIVSLDLYFQQMPAFEKLLADCGGDLTLFYKKADKLKLPPP
ncbi:MAG: aminopeptidase [Verrucomicrobiota bacterium]